MEKSKPDLFYLSRKIRISVLLAAILIAGPALANDEVGPNELQIGLGLGPASVQTHLEPRIQNEYRFGGAFFGGYGQMPDWTYDSQWGEVFRLAYLRNEWLFELDQRSEQANIEYSSYIQATFNGTVINRSSSHTGEYSQNRTSLLAGWDALHGSSRHNLYFLAGVRSMREEFLNERTVLTGLSSSGTSVIVGGASPINSTLTTSGNLYLGMDFTYQFEGPYALQFRLGLESGTGDWEETDLLYGLNNSFEYRKEIGSTELTGIELDITYRQKIDEDWTFFASLRSYRLSLRTREVIPILGNSTPPTSAQLLQDLVLTYSGAEHNGRSTALLFGFTYSYRFW